MSRRRYCLVSSKANLTDGQVASKLEQLLAARHTGDVFVSQCKTGPSQGVYRGELLILDAWAMAKSWSKPATYGYEIKASRKDFLKDDKWQRYLEYCSDFYFVCPQKIIEPNELPTEVGLLVASKNLVRLFCKKKAVRRDVEVPELLYRYVLMCRARIAREHQAEVSKREFWEQWLKDRDLSRDIGWRVSKALQEELAKKVYQVEGENLALEKKIESLEGVRRILESLGLSEGWCPEFHIREKILDQIPPNLRRAVGALSRDLENFATVLDELDAEVPAEGAQP